MASEVCFTALSFCPHDSATRLIAHNTCVHGACIAHRKALIIRRMRAADSYARHHNMKTPIVRFGFCVLALAVTSVGWGDGQVRLRDAVECSPRQGLPNWFAKMTRGEEVRIAYLGGSITAQPGYRVKTLDWFKQQYPHTKVSEINAAIGGTGSMLGAFRLRHDVLRHHPDLLFVEFAVNDAGTSPESLVQTMEGIVRQTWLADPSTDICFVYTLTEKMLAELQAGKFPRAASVMERVADHYGIPSIHMGLEVARLEKAGKLVFTAPKPTADQQGAGAQDDPTSRKIIFSRDGVHPYTDSGHQIYFEVVARSFAKLKGVGKPEAHCVCTPLTSELWQRAGIAPIAAAVRSGPWQQLTTKDALVKRFGGRLPALWQASQTGATLTFRFHGTAVGFYDLMGPDCGQVAVSIDGGQPQTRSRFDGYCSYHRLNMFMVGVDLEDTQHTVTVTLLAEPPNKARILQAHRLPDLQKNPDKYARNVWYVGGILLIGEADSRDPAAAEPAAAEPAKS